MILSQNLILSDNQAVTNDAESDNIIDLGAAGIPYGAAGPLNRDVGKGTPVPILIQITETFNNLQFFEVSIETSDSDSGGFNYVSRSSIPAAQAVAGYQYGLQVLPTNLKRYIRLFLNGSGGTIPSAGRVTAAITMGNQTNITGA